MIINKDEVVLDIDIKATTEYSQIHSLCDCNEDRNFYIQARNQFPKLTEFLTELGLLIERPDEIGSIINEDRIDYIFVSYTVVGEIKEYSKYETDMFDGGMFLSIVIDDSSIPNEQKTDRYFTVTVYGISLPWVLDEPFPDDRRTIDKIRQFLSFKKNKSKHKSNTDTNEISE